MLLFCFLFFTSLGISHLVLYFYNNYRRQIRYFFWPRNRSFTWWVFGIVVGVLLFTRPAPRNYKVSPYQRCPTVTPTAPTITVTTTTPPLATMDAASIANTESFETEPPVFVVVSDPSATMPTITTTTTVTKIDPMVTDVPQWLNSYSVIFQEPAINLDLWRASLCFNLSSSFYDDMVLPRFISPNSSFDATRDMKWEDDRLFVFDPFWEINWSLGLLESDVLPDLIMLSHPDTLDRQTKHEFRFDNQFLHWFRARSDLIQDVEPLLGTLVSMSALREEFSSAALIGSRILDTFDDLGL